MIGKLFNQRYQIIEKLGAGGTAIVYKGQDTLLGRMVTVKILREEYASNEDFVRRFRREAQAVASLSHGNIVAVYDVGFEANMHYIVMEFVEGQSLKEYIRLKGGLEVQEAASIMMQILDGIAYAHEHGIVHRDIKPHNILLGTDGRAKVTDFGIAVGMSDVTQTYNTSSRIMGSVHYIAPEQVQGHPVTERSDIYSAGVVFYEMLTGQLPFSGDTPISIAMQHVQGELILPHQLNPRIPIGLSYVVMRAMRKNPDTRYDSAKEMSEAIHSVAEGLTSIYAPPPEEGLESTRELHLASAGGGEATAEKKRARPAKQPRERRGAPPAPRRRINIMAILVLLMMGAFVVAILWAVDQFTTVMFGEEEKVTVPYVTGIQVSEAEAQLVELGLAPTVVRRNDETVGIDTVISQNPPAERSVTPGWEVILTVSDGPRLTEVPGVVGELERVAEMMLKNKGLTPEYLEPQNSEDFPEGSIIEQNPLPGTQVQGGTIVSLTVSLGPEAIPAIVPPVTEISLADARAALDEAKLLYTTRFEPSNKYYADIVIAQNPAADTEVSEGDSVQLTISQGPGPVMPTLKNSSVSVTVPNDGMSHKVRIVVADDEGTRTVFDQSLSPGYELEEPFTYLGSGTVSVYLDDALQYSKPLGESDSP